MSRSRRVLKLDGDKMTVLTTAMENFSNNMESDLSAFALRMDELTSPEVWEADAVTNFKEKFEDIKRKEMDLLESMRNLRQGLEREWGDWWVTSQNFFTDPTGTLGLKG